MECFRAIHANNLVAGTEPRITTSNAGCLFKPTFEARIRGVNKLYYQLVVNSRTVDENEVQMLSNLNRPAWHLPFSQD